MADNDTTPTPRTDTELLEDLLAEARTQTRYITTIHMVAVGLAVVVGLGIVAGFLAWTGTW